MKIKTTNEQFIEKAKLIHGEKYDYSKVSYISNKIKVEIVCKIHGPFFQKPNNHLSLKQNCPSCARISTNEYIKNNIQSNTENFIEKSKLIHGNTYDYSLVNYTTNRKKVEIVCKLHGSFLQKPNNHLNGQGCLICYGRYNFTHEIFVKKSILKHGNKYNYSKSVYVNNNTNVIIICPIHGEFSQKPSSHWVGFGCPKCSCYRISKPEIEFLDYVKIDVSNRQICISQRKVDGIDLKNKIVYEFLGDYWHGNLNKYNSSDYNKTCKKTFGELYNDTIIKFTKLKNLGYTIKYIWETDWKLFKDKSVESPNIIEFSV
jgi:hypothetical protein